MSAIPTPRYTFEEYLANECVAEHKSEFYRGEIFAMAGGSPRHNEICLNIASALKGKLRGSSCRPYSSDQRLRIPANGLSTYPDVSVVCGEIERDEVDRDALVNPRVLMEVLSPSTEDYCRGRKFVLYRQLPTLREYVVVSQVEPLMEHHALQANGTWLLTVLKGIDAVLQFASIECSLSFEEAYEGVTFGLDSGS